MAAARRCAKPRYGSFMTSSADGNRRAGPELDELPSDSATGGRSGSAVRRQFAFRSSLDGTVVDDGPLGGTGFCRRRNPIFRRSSNGGFCSWKVENALSFKGD